jgi:hypothetical protein
MNHLLSEAIKIDIALVGANQNGALTSRYFALQPYRKCMFVWLTGAMATGVTSAATVQEAQDAAATGTNLLAGKGATITAHTGVVSATITANASIAGDHVIINGLTFTAVAGAAVIASRQFSIDTGNNETAISLAAVINDATWGVPGVTATPAAAVVTLTVDEPGMTHLDITEHAATLVAADVLNLGYVEIDAHELTAAHTHVALTITNSAASQTSAICIRGNGFAMPVIQYVGAADD